MVPESELFQFFPLHVQELTYEKNICEMENHVGEEV